MALYSVPHRTQGAKLVYLILASDSRVDHIIHRFNYFPLMKSRRALISANSYRISYSMLLFYPPISPTISTKSNDPHNSNAKHTTLPIGLLLPIIRIINIIHLRFSLRPSFSTLSVLHSLISSVNIVQIQGIGIGLTYCFFSFLLVKYHVAPTAASNTRPHETMAVVKTK